ncbi:MAG: hypothetical protein HXK67_02950 [Clostridiales bacterium]|nr:hypothetical protein [Clostridiales bacterium]
MFHTFILRLRRIDKYDEKYIKKILHNINTQLKEKSEDDNFDFLGRRYIFEDFVKASSLFGAYLSDEFDDEYLNVVYKAAFDINEFAALGDSRDSIERFVEKFPIGKGLKLTTLIKKGKNLIEAVEEDFGADVLVY